MHVAYVAFATFVAVVELASAQFVGTVGPTTPLSAKQNKTCKVFDYGGTVGSDDIGPAILSAFNVNAKARCLQDCVLPNPGSTLYVPADNYNMKTWVQLNKGKQWAFRLDGFITRAATDGGNVIMIKNANDFEFYSANSAGGFQGNGYQCRHAGPVFHVSVQAGSLGELYNLAIRGANIGGSDGIDTWGDNHWVHDVMVTNKDECVTVKSPASNITIERIWCNQSGGSAIGSLGSDTAISNIVYRDVYAVGGNQAFMLKSNGGSGYVKNVLMENFLVRGSAYGLNINQYWENIDPASGDGVQLSDWVFKNWVGEVPNGVQRPPMQFLCADVAPCSNMTLVDMKMWSSTNSSTHKCQSAYGDGIPCFLEQKGTPTSYTPVTVTATRPAGYTPPATMEGDLDAGFDQASPIPTPTIPTMYFPGLPQISPLAKNAQDSTGGAEATTMPTGSLVSTSPITTAVNIATRATSISSVPPSSSSVLPSSSHVLPSTSSVQSSVSSILPDASSTQSSVPFATITSSSKVNSASSTETRTSSSPTAVVSTPPNSLTIPTAATVTGHFPGHWHHSYRQRHDLCVKDADRYGSSCKPSQTPRMMHKRRNVHSF